MASLGGYSFCTYGSKMAFAGTVASASHSRGLVVGLFSTPLVQADWMGSKWYFFMDAAMPCIVTAPATFEKTAKK
jgi:hypothetical protein